MVHSDRVQDQSQDSDYELQGLLDNVNSDSQPVQMKRDPRRHLMGQIILLGIFRSTQPLFFMVIAPFINQMLVDDLHTSDEVHVGHYSGLVEAIAAVGMCIGACVWAHYSDIYGRKKLAIYGVLVSCFFSAIFGFVRSYWLLVALRLALGLANSAQTATSKVMVSELSNMDNMARNFVYTGMGWQMGATISPMLGGLLSRPAQTWHRLFKGTLFDRYPYGLPTLATAIIPAIAALAAFYLLEETHPMLRSERVSNKSSGEPKVERGIEPVTVITSISRLKAVILSKIYPTNGLPPLFSCGQRHLMVFWFLYVFQFVAMQVAELLLFFSSQDIGGLGLTQSQMSIYLTARPFAICLYEGLVFEKLSKRFGNIPVLKTLVWLLPTIYLLYLAMSGLALAGHMTTPIIIMGLFLSLTIQVVANSVFVCGDVLIPARSPSAEQLATCNAMSELIGQLAVGTGAAIGSSLFADSVALSSDSLRGKPVWIVLFLVSLVTALVGQRFTHIDGWREKLSKSEESTVE